MTTTEPSPEFSHNPESELAQKIAIFVESHAVVPLDDGLQWYGKYSFFPDESPVLDGDELIVARSKRSTASGLHDDLLLKSLEGKVYLYLAVNSSGRVSINGVSYDHAQHYQYIEFVAFLGTDRLEPDPQTKRYRRQRDVELEDIYEMFRSPLRGSPDSGQTP